LSRDAGKFEAEAKEIKASAAKYLSLAGRILGTEETTSDVMGNRTYGMSRSLGGSAITSASGDIKKADELGDDEAILGSIAKVVSIYYNAIVPVKKREKLEAERLAARREKLEKEKDEGIKDKDETIEAYDEENKIRALRKAISSIRPKSIVKNLKRGGSLTSGQKSRKAKFERDLNDVYIELMPYRLDAIIDTAKTQNRQYSAAKGESRIDATNRDTRREALNVLADTKLFLDSMSELIAKGKNFEIEEDDYERVFLPFLDSLAFLYMTQTSRDGLQQLTLARIGGDLSQQAPRAGGSLLTAAERYADYGSALREMNRILINQFE
jgi:hypothetical protein